MFVVAKTGLVPVISLKGTRTGIFGVLPRVARAGVLSKELALAKVPEEIEGYQVPDPAAPVVRKEAPPSVETVDIEAEWEDFHPLKRIKLAQDILGERIVLTPEVEAADVKKTDKADIIIREELQRRAAAETPAE